MKDIKTKVREALDSSVNIRGVKVSRPNQVLIITRGIPVSSGKSTKAKSLVGNGVIHSTDDVIESQYNYREFFESMIANKDFAPLSRAHSQNLRNAKESIQKGISPVIIDNTNIRADEPKNYIEYALDQGFADENIKFVEVGDGGVSAEELANRNTHGVPLDKIKSMIQAYKSAGPMTLEKVINAKSRFSNKPKMFASLVLDSSSQSKLLEATKQYIPEGWKVFAHHMTINFGKGLPENLKSDLGRTRPIRAIEIGISDMAIAVKVDGYHSDNDIPHITIAVNPSGGKPVMSNNIQNWKKLVSYINLSGVVEEKKLGL